MTRPRVMRRAMRYVGRRGASLVFIAALAAVFCYSLAAYPTDSQMATLGQLVPLWVWSIAWGLTSVACLVAVFTIRDWFAFVSAVAMMTAWGLLYLTAWAMGAAERGWLGGAVYLAFAAFFAVLCGWPEPVVTNLDVLSGDYPDGIVTADSHGCITGWAGSAAGMFGWAAPEIVGQPLTVLMPERYRDAHTLGLAHVRATGESALAGQTLDLTGLHRNGSEFGISLFITVADAGRGLTLSAAIRRTAKTGPPWRVARP